MQAEVTRLKSALDEKNHEFLNNLVLEKYAHLDNIKEDVVTKFNEQILVNSKLTNDYETLQANYDNLNKQFISLKDKFNKLQKDAQIAQEKRSGHYAKLISALDKQKELEIKIGDLQKKIVDKEHTLTWLLGIEILKCKKPLNILLLPFNIFSAYKKFKYYQNNKKNHTILTTIKNSIEIEKESKQNNLKDLTTDINILGWPEPSKDKPITIMSIADEFTTSNLKSVANLITPRPDNWRGLLNRDKPSLLFVESAWNGNKNSWQYRVGSYTNPPGKELFDAIAEFKKQSIPTVFWNKEDPVHFDKFKNTAKEFDFIFTSDEGSISHYQKISKAKVLTLPFAADSQVNNPIGSNNRENKVCFAGSYYANRFIERRNDQIMLLESALPYGLDIYDRNAGNANTDFHFPEQFKDCIKGSLPYDQMNQTYKKYKVFLNVNSVIDSKTMFSRRVFELLASGTPIVSTPSLGIDEFFGKDLVWTVKNKEEAQEAIYTLLNDEVEWRRRSLQGIRNVFLNHTFKDRFQFILEEVGLANIRTDVPKILYCTEAYQQEEIDNFQLNLNYQNSFGKFEIVPLIILKNAKLKTSLPSIMGKGINLVQLIREFLKENTSIKFITFFTNHNIYGKNYLLDLYLATQYTNAEIISKNSFDSYIYSDKYLPSAALFKREVFEKEMVMGNFDLLVNTPIISSLPVFLSDSANFAKKSSNISKQLAQIEM
nr:glycosyltransferase [Neisseria lisongii]